MKFKLNVIALLLCSAALSTFAQDDQTTKADKMGEGKFMQYISIFNDGAYTFEGMEKESWDIKINPFHEGLKELMIKKFETSTSSDGYYPDNAAFPCTFISGRLQNHKAMVGYLGISFSNDNRIVFIDEYVYVLKKWKDKNNYVIDKVLKKGELTGMKLMKAAMTSKKDMAKANHPETLQKYLDDAFKKQAEVVASGDGKKKSDDYTNALAAGEKRWTLVVDSINGKYWNSEEGKKKLAETQLAKVTLVNDTKSEFLFCHGQGVSTFLKPGEKHVFSCKNGIIYKGERIPNNSFNLKKTSKVLYNFDGTNCGITIKASSLN